MVLGNFFLAGYGVNLACSRLLRVSGDDCRKTWAGDERDTGKKK